MKCNVGKTDKIIRFILALAGLILGFVYNPWFYLVTVLGVATASMSFCPLYKILGMSTCNINHDEFDKNSVSAPVDNANTVDTNHEEKSQE